MVHFPVLKDNEPLHFKALYANFARFSLLMGDLQGKVTFGTLAMYLTNGDINVAVSYYMFNMKIPHT